jgi:hypothetical protein
MPGETKQPGSGRTVAFREEDLKICDLCGWLNLDTNTECFVCGWHGRFEHDPEIVRAALELATRRYGRLELQHLTDLRTYREPPPPPLKARFRHWFRRMWRWLRG